MIVVGEPSGDGRLPGVCNGCGWDGDVVVGGCRWGVVLCWFGVVGIMGGVN